MNGEKRDSLLSENHSYEPIAAIRSYLKEHLSESRLKHVEGVEKMAISLAKLYNVDPFKAQRAALYHDMAKSFKVKDLNEYVRKYKLSKKYLDRPNLSHGKVGAFLCRELFQETDEDVINAVSYHTTGRANMSTLEKIVYLADCLEEGRSYPGVEDIRRLSYENLDKALIKSMEKTIELLRLKGAYIDEDTIDALKFYKAFNKN